MLLGIQDFDFCPNLIKFYTNFTQFIQIVPKFFPNFPKFTQILPKFCQKFAQIYLKNLLGDADASPAPTPLSGWHFNL